MYVIKKTGIDGTVQYVSSIKLSNNRPDIKYQSNPSDAMPLTDIPSAKALVQLAGAAFASTIEIVDFETCLTAAQANMTFAGMRYADMEPGTVVTWGGIDWLVVKRTPKDAKVYLMTETHIGSTPYAKSTYNAKHHCVDNTGVDFKYSNLFSLCKYMNKSLIGEPDFDKLVTTPYGLKVGVMTREMLSTIDGQYVYNDGVPYWTSTAGSPIYVYIVYADGGLNCGSLPGNTYGFRPYICVKMSDK